MGTSLPSNKIVSAERFMRGLGNERSAAGGRGGAVFFCKRLAAPASLQPYHRHTARPPGQTRPPLRPRGRQKMSSFSGSGSVATSGNIRK